MIEGRAWDVLRNGSSLTERETERPSHLQPAATARRCYIEHLGEHRLACVTETRRTFTTVNLRWMRDRGQSIGKRLCKLRVVYADGRRMPLGRMVRLRDVLPFAISLAPIAGAVFAVLDIAFG